jgi:hypothetical protein
MNWVQPLFEKYPELAVFLALGLGYAIGRVTIRGFSLGGSTGSLLAGLLIGGLVAPPVNATAKSVLFMLFLFGIGYTVGPKFAKAMKLHAGPCGRAGTIGQHDRRARLLGLCGDRARPDADVGRSHRRADVALMSGRRAHVSVFQLDGPGTRGTSCSTR